MGKSGYKNFTLLMKHVDPFYRFGFDDVISDHVHRRQSPLKDVGLI